MSRIEVDEYGEYDPYDGTDDSIRRDERRRVLQRVSEVLDATVDEYQKQLDLIFEHHAQQHVLNVIGPVEIRCNACRAERYLHEYPRCKTCWFIVCPNCPGAHDCSKSPKEARLLTEKIRRDVLAVDQRDCPKCHKTWKGERILHCKRCGVSRCPRCRRTHRC